MPAAAVRAGLSDAILPLKEIAGRIMRAVQEGTR